jgi:glycosyltransferase involved in cell wall biosynthesis
MPVVPDVADAYAKSDLVVVPIRFGTGLKIKTIEAMGRGLPTVSTTVGAEGLEEAHESALMIADSPAQFTAAILRLLQDETERRRLSEESLAFARRWNSQMQSAFANVLRRLPAATPQAAD